jgi:hypothetical protein
MTTPDGESWDLSWLNFPGIIAGIALMVLPFLDVWWRFTLGDGAVVIGTSPFHVLIESFGTEITSPLLSSLNIGLAIIIIYYGLLLFAGSVLRMRKDRRSMADFLVRISARKLPWFIVFFIVSVAISDVIINHVFSLMGVQAQVPYFVGDSVIPLGMGIIPLNVPITQGFTGIFIIAVLVSILSLTASLYQDRVTLVKTPGGLRFRRIPEQPPIVPPLQEETAETTGTGR